MANATKLIVGANGLPIADAEARAKANQGLELASTLAAQSIGDDIGRNLAALFAAEILNYDNPWQWLQARVQSANYEGILIGDYLDLHRTDGEDMRYRIAAIDPYYNCADTPQPHHVAMVPDETVVVTGSYAVNGGNIMWNTTNTNQGTAAEKHPYLVSNLHAWETNVFYGLLPEIVRNAILERRSLVEERYTNGTSLTASNSWSWASLGKIWSLSEVEVQGFQAWGTAGYSSGFDTHFPLFAQCKDRIRDKNGSRVNWWLRTPSGASASNVCAVTSTGDVTGDYAPTNTHIRPLPCFLVG